MLFLVYQERLDMKNNIVIAIHYGHTATAGISINGKIECVLSEERICRLKNARGFPYQALQYITDTYLNGDINLADKIVVSDASWNVVRANEQLGWQPQRYLDYFALTRKDTDMAYLRWYMGLNKKPSAYKHFKQQLKNKIKSCFTKGAVQSEKTLSDAECLDIIAALIGVDKTKIINLDHHTAHSLASLYFVDNAQTYLMFSIDGAGDYKSSTVSIWDGKELKRLSCSSDTDSLGELYTYVTAYLGMKPNEHEFKVMGMAPYAYHEQVLRVKKYFENIFVLNEKGAFELKIPFEHLPSYLIRHLTYERFDNISGAIQLFTEEMITRWVAYWINKTGISAVTFGGGVAMNVKAMKQVYDMPEVTKLFVMPSGGDESLPIGCLWYGNALLKQSIVAVKDLYLGREFADDYIRKYLETVKDRYEYEELTEDEMAVKVGALLADNQIVARCCGREEWGARALGNRSILCNARYFKNIDVLNQYIKSRDFWMPFTPSILAEDVNEYVYNPRDMFAPYMCITFDASARAKENIPAALHPRDYTVRPQAVLAEWNSGYYKIINEFKKLTGISGVLNTSFNLHGEPNVGGPEDAIHTLDNSRLKYVILGNFLVTKK